jgi:hypothetical protein
VVAHPKDVILYDADFTVQYSTFDYDAVDSLRFEYTSIKLMAGGLVHQGTVHHPELDIYIRNHKQPLKLRLPWRFVANPATHTKKKADEMLAVYDELSRRTFSARARRHVTQIEKEHYFTYDSKRFAEDGRVFSQSGSILFVLSEVQLLKYPFHLRCVVKDNIFDKMSLMLTRSYIVKTQYDRDVFFALLDQMYHIRWP